MVLAALRARADGYTITIGTASTHVLNGAFYSLPYDVLNDFVPISPLVTAPFLLCAKKTMTAKELNELIVWLKANPSKASAAIGASTIRLLAAFFQRETGTQFAFVPYRGGPPAVQDLMAGQIDFSFLTPDFLPLVRAGSMRAYAVTRDTRLALAKANILVSTCGLLLSSANKYDRMVSAMSSHSPSPTHRV